MVVFDTDFIIALSKQDPLAQQIFLKYQENNEEMIITTFTWYELLCGVWKASDRSARLKHLHECVSGGSMLLFDDTAATIAARNEGILMSKGKQTGVVDNFIAAACLSQNQTLVTRNIKHFQNIPGLKVKSW